MEEEVIGKEFSATSKNIPLNNKEVVDLPAYAVGKQSKVFADDEDSPLDSVGIDIQEAIFCEEKNVVEEANVEPQSFSITRSVEVYDAEHENTLKGVEELPLKQEDEQDIGANSDASLHHQTVTTEQISIEELSHSENEKCQRMATQTEKVVQNEDELFFETVDFATAMILPGSREKEDYFLDKNSVPRSKVYDNANAELEQVNESGDETATGNIRTSTAARQFTDFIGTEWHPVVFDQTPLMAEKTSNLSILTKETGKSLENDI